MSLFLPLLLPLGLAFLMFVVGLRLAVGEIAACFARPKALIAGLLSQVVALPGLAAGLAALFGLDGALAAGLVIVAAAPGGITSNYAALLARADVALSTAMTLTTSLFAFVTIPLALAIFGLAPKAGTPALAGMSLAMAATCAVPLAAGIAARRFAPGWTARAEISLDRAARIVFAGIVAATFWTNRGAMADHAASVGPAVAALNLGALALAASIATGFGLGDSQRRAIMVETGLQNVAMALFVAERGYGGGALTIPPLLYAVAMNISLMGLIWSGRRRLRAA